MRGGGGAAAGDQPRAGDRIERPCRARRRGHRCCSCARRIGHAGRQCHCFSARPLPIKGGWKTDSGGERAVSAMLNESGGGPWGGSAAAARAAAARAAAAATASARAIRGASRRASARPAAAGPTALDELLRRGRARFGGGGGGFPAAPSRRSGSGRSAAFVLLWIAVHQLPHDRPAGARRRHPARQLCRHADAGHRASPCPRRSTGCRRSTSTTSAPSTSARPPRARRT